MKYEIPIIVFSWATSKAKFQTITIIMTYLCHNIMLSQLSNKSAGRIRLRRYYLYFKLVFVVNTKVKIIKQ